MEGDGAERLTESQAAVSAALGFSSRWKGSR